jgi:hypothetical protein
MAGEKSTVEILVATDTADDGIEGDLSHTEIVLALEGQVTADRIERHEGVIGTGEPADDGTPEAFAQGVLEVATGDLADEGGFGAGRGGKVSHGIEHYDT